MDRRSKMSRSTGAEAATSRASLARREVHVIRPRRPGVFHRLADLWRYRQLVPFFGRRYIQKLYARTWLGWTWIPLRPAIDVSMRTILFGGLLAVPSAGLPYFLFFLIGTAAWQLFERTATWSTRSLELNRGFLKRIYVPRLTPLVASIIPSVLDLLLYGVMATIAFGYYWLIDGRVYAELSVRTLWCVLGFFLLPALGLSVGLWTATYAARARDIRFALRYVLGIWYFVTPVIYPLGAIPSGFQRLAQLNPATAPVEMVKFGILGTGSVPYTSLYITLGFIAVVGGLGLWFFGRTEDAAVDSL